MQQKDSVALVVGNDSGSQPIRERIPAREIGANRFKLLRSPGLVEGLAAGDEIEVFDDARFRVIQRGSNVCVWVYFESRIEEQATNELRTEVEKLGGYLDGGTHASLIFTIPVSVGFTQIERVFEQFTRARPKTTWMFANVYDPADGRTPLDWWKSGDNRKN